MSFPVYVLVFIYWLPATPSNSRGNSVAACLFFFLIVTFIVLIEEKKIALHFF